MKFCRKCGKLVSEFNHLDINSYLDDITYESILNECQHIGNGLNKNGFQTVLVSMYTTLNTLYNDDFVNKLKLYVDHLISLKTLRDVE